MGAQFGAIGAAMLAAMFAVPYCYNHRMDGGVLIGTLLAFTGMPLVVGLLAKRAYRSVTLVALALLVLCPVVFIITDPLAVEFEKMRDSYFLGTFSAILLVSTTWYVSSNRSGKWLQYLMAILGGTSSSLAIFVLLWMIMVFE